MRSRSGSQLRLRHLGGGRYDVDDIVQRSIQPDQPARLCRASRCSISGSRDGGIDFTDDAVGAPSRCQLTLKLPFISSLEQREEGGRTRAELPAQWRRGRCEGAAATVRARRAPGPGTAAQRGNRPRPWLPYWPAALPLRDTSQL